jgi:PRC-barrel domain
MSLPSHDEARRWPGLTVLDRDGDTVGRITHIYLDRESGQPEWALVAMPERGRVFVPLSGASAADDRVRVLVTKVTVREAPAVASGRELTQQDETRLYRHYGVADSAADHGARRSPPNGGGRAKGDRVKGAANRLSQVAGGAGSRLREAGGRARGVATSAPARRALSAAGAASALGAAAAVARRSRAPRRGGLTGALDGLLDVPAAAFRRRRRRQRVRAAGRLLGSTATAPMQAVGNLGAELGRRVPPALPRPLSRKRRSKMAGNFKLAAGLAAGYVLGARAGRERYERLVGAARQVANRPEVQQLAGKLRGGLGTGLDKAANAASDRLEQARPHTEEASSHPESSKLNEVDTGRDREPTRSAEGARPTPAPSRPPEASSGSNEDVEPRERGKARTARPRS